MNTLYILLDGAEDHPIPEFGNRKPLDVARMPFLDSAGRYKGTTEGRGYTHLFLNEFFTGHPPSAPRAAIEAIGLGMDMSGGRTAYRLSPACIRNNRIRWIYDLDDVYEKLVEAAERNMGILEHMDPEIDFFLNGRAILTMRCDDIPELPSPPSDADLVEVPGDLGMFVRSIAKELDGFTVYPWGCGRVPGDNHPPYIERMTAISNTPTAIGVSGSLGHRMIRIRDIEERIIAAKDHLKDNDVFLHIDEIDEYSHQKDPAKKVAVLEECDRILSEHFTDEDRMVFFVDHGTSSVTGEHILMDVPFWTSFDIGAKGKVPLKELVPMILNAQNDKS